ncbi:nuclear transport factor 2 family protein [Haloprofundus sp. MHR1]|uniref:nuclear transport factor 2 family protein n=1 Tax=Haloprofundus sp. MHR1 TaxID=2572921 RepID=UPI0010BF4153|nr:nuclear transport factor 2 family protein [Haloprofundus sp. MHR1]QCJ45742.1 nuclear transport factor 2 family protein [Haloprofundus sp. MHR1]
MDHVAVVRAYYSALDEHDYPALSDHLAPTFVHDRPDRTLDGRETFVSFMRDERPNKRTSHELDEIYENGDGSELVVRGRLLGVDGERLFEFVDVHRFEGDVVAELRTFARDD